MVAAPEACPPRACLLQAQGVANLKGEGGREANTFTQMGVRTDVQGTFGVCASFKEVLGRSPRPPNPNSVFVSAPASPCLLLSPPAFLGSTRLPACLCCSLS